MYSLHREIPVAAGSASPFPAGLSTYYNSERKRHFAAIANRYQINFISWDDKVDTFTNDSVPVKEPGIERSILVTEAKLVYVNSRTEPLLVVATVDGFLVFPAEGKTPLHYAVLQRADNESYRLAKGIASVRHYIVVGTHSGEAHVLSVGESSVRTKANLKELLKADYGGASQQADGAGGDTNAAGGGDQSHRAIVSAASGGDGQLVLATAGGALALYTACSQGIKHSQTISTRERLTSVALCGAGAPTSSDGTGAVAVGTATGCVLLYELPAGRLLAAAEAHARPVADLAATAKSNFLISVSEDSFVRVWRVGGKRKGDGPLELEQSVRVPDAPLAAVAVNDARATSFVAAAYDFGTLFYFKAAADAGGKGKK